MVPPPKDLPFSTYLFNILWFGMINDNRAVNWKGWPYIYISRDKHVYIYTGICVESTKRGKHIKTHTRRHIPKFCKLCKLSWVQDSRFWGKLLESRPWLSSRAPCQSALGFKKLSHNLESWILNPKKLQALQTFLDSRFKIQDSGRNFLNPGLDCHPGPHVSQRLDSRSFSQNLESWIPKIRKLCKLSWIQDSRFWEKLLESRPWLSCLDSRSSSHNLESWILSSKSLQTLQTFLASSFKILRETSWIQALTVIQGPMSVSAWIQEVFLRILNLESQKIANFANFPGSINKRYVRGIEVFSRSVKWYL